MLVKNVVTVGENRLALLSKEIDHDSCADDSFHGHSEETKQYLHLKQCAKNKSKKSTPRSVHILRL